MSQIPSLSMWLADRDLQDLSAPLFAVGVDRLQPLSQYTDADISLLKGSLANAGVKPMKIQQLATEIGGIRAWMLAHNYAVTVGGPASGPAPAPAPSAQVIGQAPSNSNLARAASGLSMPAYGSQASLSATAMPNGPTPAPSAPRTAPAPSAIPRGGGVLMTGPMPVRPGTTTPPPQPVASGLPQHPQPQPFPSNLPLKPPQPFPSGLPEFAPRGGPIILTGTTTPPSTGPNITSLPMYPPTSNPQPKVLEQMGGIPVKLNTYSTTWSTSQKGKGLALQSPTCIITTNQKYCSVRANEPIPKDGIQYFEVTFSDWGYFGLHVGVVCGSATRFDPVFEKGRSLLTKGPSWSLAYPNEIEHWSPNLSNVAIQKVSLEPRTNVIGVCVDMDKHSLRFRINDTWTESFFNDLPDTLYPAVSLGYKIGLTATISFPPIPPF